MIFEEAQAFRQSSVRILLALPPLFLLFILIRQVWFGHPWGRHPMSNGNVVFLFALLLLLYARLVTVKLVIAVSSTGIRAALRGALWRTVIAGDRIQSARIVSYHAVRDYGGYGIRSGKRGRAYIAGGTRGVLLVLKDRSQVLLGSARPEQLAQAIVQAFCINLEA